MRGEPHQLCAGSFPRRLRALGRGWQCHPLPPPPPRPRPTAALKAAAGGRRRDRSAPTESRGSSRGSGTTLGSVSASPCLSGSRPPGLPASRLCACPSAVLGASSASARLARRSECRPRGSERLCSPRLTRGTPPAPPGRGRVLMQTRAAGSRSPCSDPAGTDGKR